MDPKGLFLSLLNTYCMCGPTIEVNIQCLLPVLPAVFHCLNFLLSRMRPYWAHLNCLFLLLNKQNIALGPQLNLISLSTDRGANVLHVVLWKTINVVEVNVFKNTWKTTKLLSFSEGQTLLVNSFTLADFVWNKNSPMGEFKPRPKSGHLLVQWMVHLIGLWVCFNCSD